MQATDTRLLSREARHEPGFENIVHSSRHNSEIALRYPRMLRWREDKPVEAADTLQILAALLPGQAA